MGVNGLAPSAALQQVQLSMLTAALGQQQSIMSSMSSAAESIDLSFMGKGQFVNVQA